MANPYRGHGYFGLKNVGTRISALFITKVMILMLTN